MKSAETSNLVSSHLSRQEQTLLGEPSPQSLEVNASVDRSVWAAHRECIDSATDTETVNTGRALSRDEDTLTGLCATNITSNTCHYPFNLSKVLINSNPF